MEGMFLNSTDLKMGKILVNVNRKLIRFMKIL